MAFNTPYPSILLCNPEISHNSLHPLPHRSCFPQQLERVHIHGKVKSFMLRPPCERTCQHHFTTRLIVSPSQQRVEPKAPPPSPSDDLLQRRQNFKHWEVTAASSSYDADAALFQPLLSNPIESQNATNALTRVVNNDLSQDLTLDAFLGQNSADTPKNRRSPENDPSEPWPLRESNRSKTSDHRKAQSLPFHSTSRKMWLEHNSKHPRNKSLALNIHLISPSPIVNDLTAQRPNVTTPTLLPSPSILQRKPTPHSARVKPRSPTTPTPLRLFPPSPTSTTSSKSSHGYDGGQLSPASSTFARPSLQMPMQCQPFEDDDEKMGLMEYVRNQWSSSAGKTKNVRDGKKALKKKSKGRTCGGCWKWRKVLCGFCDAHDSDEE